MGREMRLSTWAACAFCFKLKRRAAASGSAVARRLDAARRAHVLLLTSSPPRALTAFDVGVSLKGALAYRDARGVISARHPGAGPDALVPVGCVLRLDGTVAEPLSPPPGSAFELVPHASTGALVYYDRDLGRVQWEPPPDSTPLQARLLGEPGAGEAFGVPPPRFPARLSLDAQSLRCTGWMPMFEDIDSKVYLYHSETGCVRAAPWISLRTEAGCIFFCNVLTQETWWLPPRLWMPGWVSRPRLCPKSGLEIGSPFQHCRRLADQLLPRAIARKRVEGGAPYMHEQSDDKPQYPPNECDTA